MAWAESWMFLQKVWLVLCQQWMLLNTWPPLGQKPWIWSSWLDDLGWAINILTKYVVEYATAVGSEALLTKDLSNRTSSWLEEDDLGQAMNVLSWWTRGAMKRKHKKPSWHQTRMALGESWMFWQKGLAGFWPVNAEHMTTFGAQGVSQNIWRHDHLGPGAPLAREQI